MNIERCYLEDYNNIMDGSINKVRWWICERNYINQIDKKFDWLKLMLVFRDKL